MPEIIAASIGGLAAIVAAGVGGVWYGRRVRPANGNSDGGYHEDLRRDIKGVRDGIDYVQRDVKGLREDVGELHKTDRELGAALRQHVRDHHG